MKRTAIVLVDGEHYPDVTREALAGLPFAVAGAVLVGGTEKLRGELTLDVCVFASLEEAIAATDGATVVFDLSDEPVLSPPDRLRLASVALAHGLAYEGPGFRFEPPLLATVDLPTLAVTGTGKRIGKTAVSALAASLAARDLRVAVLAMGRGGPAEPELVTQAPGVPELLALSREGRHAASDHLEIAALTGLPTVGCRRAGGGLAGEVARSNVLEGLALIGELAPELVLLDGSGAALPPVAADRRVLVSGAHQDVHVAAGYLNHYRALLADLVVVTMAEETAGDAVARALRLIVRPGVAVLEVVLRPRPLASVDGAGVAFFCTAPAAAHVHLAAHLRDAHGAARVAVSGALGDRERLSADLAGLAADVVLVELKGAAVDAVLEAAERRGIPVILAGNDVVATDGSAQLEDELRRLASEAVAAKEPAAR